MGPTSLLKSKGNVLRELASNGDNDTTGILQFVNIHYSLVAELFKVQFISGIKISRVSLWIVIDHDSLFAHLSQGECSIDGAPVKFHRASNPVHTTPQDDRTMVVKRNVMRRSVISGIEIVGIRRELSRESVNLFYPRPDSEALPPCSNVVFG